MSISDAQFERWLSNTSKAPRACLFELTFLGQGGSPVGGIEFKAYVSNVPYITRATDSPAHQEFDDCVLEVPSFTRRMGEQLAGRSTQSYGDLIIANPSNERSEWLSMNWDGRRIRQWLGDPSWPFADFRCVLDGTIVDVFDPGGAKIGFKISDKGALLNRPVMTTVLDDAAGVTPESGDLMPLALGYQLFNITPKLVDSSDKRYRFTQTGGTEEPYTDTLSVSENPSMVREDGVQLISLDTLASSNTGGDLLHVVGHGYPAGTRIQFPFDGVTAPPAPLQNTVSAAVIFNYWVSTDGLVTDDFKVAPTLADALAGTNSINLTGAQTGTPDIQAYGWTAPGDGTFTLAGTPLKPITADLFGLGIRPPGSPTAAIVAKPKVGGIIELVFTSTITNTPLDSSDLDSASLTALDALALQPVSIYITERMTFAELLDKLLISVGGWWGFSRDGLLQVGRLDLPVGGSPIATFDQDDIALRSLRMVRRILPKTDIRVSGNINWTPQATVAGSVTVAEQARFAREKQTMTGSAVVTTWDTDPENHFGVQRPDAIETLAGSINLDADLTAEAERLAEMFQFPTAVWSFDTNQSVYLRALGEEIYVEHPKFTGYGVIVGITERPKGRSTLEFFAQMPDVYPDDDL